METKKTVTVKTSLLVLAIVSLVISRVAFLFINDPEGPNLLIVVVLAAIIYLAALALYFFYSRINS